MIKISKQVDYGIQFLQELAKKEANSPLSIADFSKKSSISFLFLQKIAKKLKDANMVTATKGANGGYILKRPLSTINMKELIETIDGSFGVVDCQKKGKACPKEKKCGVKPLFEGVNEQVLSVLSSTYLM